MNKENKMYWRQIAIALLGGTLILGAVIIKFFGWLMPFNLLAMFGGLMASKCIIDGVMVKRGWTIQ